MKIGGNNLKDSMIEIRKRLDDIMSELADITFFLNEVMMEDKKKQLEKKTGKKI